MAVTQSLVPDAYTTTLEELKQRVHAARFQTQRNADMELLRLWWSIGRNILDRQRQETVSSLGVLERLVLRSLR